MLQRSPTSYGWVCLLFGAELSNNCNGGLLAMASVQYSPRALVFPPGFFFRHLALTSPVCSDTDLPLKGKTPLLTLPIVFITMEDQTGCCQHSGRHCRDTGLHGGLWPARHYLDSGGRLGTWGCWFIRGCVSCFLKVLCNMALRGPVD